MSISVVGAAARIELAPSCDAAGPGTLTVLVTGDGFGPATTVRVSATGPGATAAVTTTATRSGTIRTELRLPARRGTFTVVATPPGRAAGPAPAAAFTVPCGADATTTSTSTTSTTRDVTPPPERDAWPAGPVAIAVAAALLLAVVAAAVRRRERKSRSAPRSPTPQGIVELNASMQVAPPVATPGSPLIITVSADTPPADMVVGVALVIPPELGAVTGPGSALLAADGAGRITFSALVDPAAEPGSVARVSALFSHGNRPCGALSTLVPVAATRRAGPPQLAASVLRIEPGAAPPDLLVRITATAANDGRSFMCEVLERGGEPGPGPEPWILRDAAPSLVAARLAEFTAGDMTARQRRDVLVGAGRELFDVAPARFQQVLWRLVDEGRPPRSIFVCSEEPAIPWELMVPNRTLASGPELHEPLGVAYAFGRWVGDPASDPRLGNALQAPIQVAPFERSVVIAPVYTGNQFLKWSEAEADLVAELFPGERLAPADYDRIDTGLASATAGLLHFVGHGRAEAELAQVLVLEGRQSLSSTALRGMEGARSFGRRCHPAVFLNACEVGRLQPALTGADGFATAFIRDGARCVIAPLWSVKDSIAHEVATAFYRQHAADPSRPLGEVFQTIRRRAYGPDGGEDSYAAYAFFGDPLSRAGR